MEKVERVRLYVWLFAVTGARRGEVVALQWDDIDLVAARLVLLGLRLDGRAWLCSAKPDLSWPRDPASLMRRYRRLMAKLGIEILLMPTLALVHRG